MNKVLQIAPELSLPLDAVTEAYAILPMDSNGARLLGNLLLERSRLGGQ